MILSIKKVKQCKNGAYGNYLLRGRERADITISMKLNRTLADYGATLLHEVLHAWTTLMRKEGFKVTDKKEHLFIYAAEKGILKAMKATLRRK